jgi:hypothetical protein
MAMRTATPAATAATFRAEPLSGGDASFTVEASADRAFLDAILCPHCGALTLAEQHEHAEEE